MSVLREWRDVVAMTTLLLLISLATAFLVDGAAAAILLLVGSVAAVIGAWKAGYSPSSLGLAPGDFGSGLRLGLLISACVVAVVALAAWIPLSRDFFEDTRFDDLTNAELAFELGFRIPIITALSEELLFRSVLLAALMARTSMRLAVGVSSLMFGLWHVSTTIGDLDGNEVTDSLTWWGATLSVGAVVAVTGVAGVAFCWLRLRSRSVVAPWLVHLTVNASTFGAGAILAES